MRNVTHKAFLMFNVVLLTGSLASSLAQKRGSPDAAIKLNTELVILDAHVFNKRTGRVVGGLRNQDFTLYEDGVKQHIGHFSQDKLPLSIVLLLDISGSVWPVFDQIQDRGLRTLQQLKAADEVALMAFDTEAVLIQDFTKERRRIVDKVANTDEMRSILNSARQQPGDGTHIGDSIHGAAHHLRKAANPLGRRIIIVVTDNEPAETWVLRSQREVVRELFDSGSVVYGLVVPSGYKTSKIVKYSPSYRMLKNIWRDNGGNVNTYAEATGGVVLDARKNQAEAKLEELIECLRSRYTLGYVPVNLRRDGTFRQIRLKISSDVEKREGKLTVLTRKGYYALRSDSTNQVDSTTPVTTPKN